MRAADAAAMTVESHGHNALSVEDVSDEELDPAEIEGRPERTRTMMSTFLSWMLMSSLRKGAARVKGLYRYVVKRRAIGVQWAEE